MNCNIYYAGKINQIEIADEKIIPVVYPNEKCEANENLIISKSISNPLSSKSFKEFISDDDKLLIVVNDGARPTPTAKILESLHPFITNKKVKFIIATGSHRNPNENELKIIFGNFYDYYKQDILFHNAKDESENIYIGTTSSGNKIYLNKIILDFKKIVTINSVEPHYFAGYTGGRKSILPGIASYNTIEYNHKFAMEPEAKGLALKGNPVHEDMVEAVSLLKEKEMFSIQVVLDIERKIFSVSSGNIFDSFSDAVSNAKKIFCAKAKEKADIVLAVASHPSDLELYQAQKAVENGKLLLKDSGILILVAQCKTGLGQQAFYDLLAGCDTPSEVFHKISKGYKLGYHKAAKLADLMIKSQIWAVTDLDEEMMSKIFIKKYSKLEKAISDAIEKKGSTAKIAILNDAGNIVPIIE
ncbi:MAG: nickel-dependent lactate racemase [Ignavibacteriales bacterium]|nr:nickel-dependent lactate racemase [Ignavibacteriales bacterium]